MSQVLFLIGLYGFGVYFGLLFKRQLPLVLIVITGFLWGALFWVLGGMTLLILTIPYTAASMSILFIILVIGISILHARNKTWQLSRRELIYISAFALVYLLILLLANQFNFSVASTDSIIYILTGRRIPYEGFSQSVMVELADRGAFLPLLQSASVFLGDDYIYAAQPAFGLSLAGIYFYLSHRILGHLHSDKRLALTLSILSGLVLFSTYFVVFQTFYIHTNLICAVYLFLSVCGFWLASVEGEDSWMIVGMLALTGFSLARLESPVFALVFLVLLISYGKIPYRIRLVSILPYLISLIIWYFYLLRGVGDVDLTLDQTRILAIIGALAAVIFLVIFSEVNWIKRWVLPHLPKIMLGVLVLVVAFMVIQKPEHMYTSMKVTLKNVLESGRWGITWVVFALLFLISLFRPGFLREEYFFYGISSFLLLLLAISYFRVPYRVGWGDSANRMLVHILPTISLYVMMRVGQVLLGNDLIQDRALSEKGK